MKRIPYDELFSAFYKALIQTGLAEDRAVLVVSTLCR